MRRYIENDADGTSIHSPRYVAETSPVLILFASPFLLLFTYIASVQRELQFPFKDENSSLSPSPTFSTPSSPDPTATTSPICSDI